MIPAKKKLDQVIEHDAAVKEALEENSKATRKLIETVRRNPCRPENRVDPKQKNFFFPHRG